MKNLTTVTLTIALLFLTALNSNALDTKDKITNIVHREPILEGDKSFEINTASKTKESGFLSFLNPFRLFRKKDDTLQPVPNTPDPADMKPQY